VPKSFVTVNRHDGNIVLIFCEQIRIRFDVDFFEGESLVTARGLNRVLGFVAEVAPGSRINDYMRFGQLTTPSAENIAAEIPENMLPAALHKNPNIACLEVKLQRSSQIPAPGWLCNPGYENRNNINSEGVRERFQRCVRHTPGNPGLETQTGGCNLRTPLALEFLCKALAS
jgi:hypothetical protein